METENKEQAAMDMFAFQRALDINIIMSVTDRKGIIISVNKRFCEVSQYNEEELVGKSHNVINSGFHSKDFFATLWKVIMSGNVWHGEIKNRAKDGSYYWVDTVIVPVFDNNEKIQQFLSLRVLITDRKEAELALAQATFTLSHKIRHPLVNMQALLTICLQDEISKQELKQMADLMQTELNKMDMLTRQMAADLDNYKKNLSIKYNKPGG